MAAPVFDPPDGTYTPVNVTITTATADASIYYTINGTIPTTSSALYTAPIAINDQAILQAVAVKFGMADSETSRAIYNRPYLPPAQTLERSIAGTVCRPEVRISVTPADGTFAYAVEENLPPGLAPANISDNGVWNEESLTIRWGAFLDGSTRILTYELIGPDSSYSLSGTGSFDGRSQDISGSTQTAIDCIPDQAAKPVLDPPSGTRVPLNVTMTTVTEGAEIRYTTDGTEPDEFSTLYISPVILNTGATVKAKAFKAGLAPSDTAAADYLPAMRPKAIIVSGGGPFEGNSLWAATKLVSAYAYHALLYQGYAKDDILFLSPDLTLDVDGNGELDDIDDVATRASMEHAITSWAVNATELLLYFTDHGGNETFMLGQSDILNSSDLASWLNTLQETISGRVTVIYDACQSGTFLTDLIPPASKQRIIITSASNEPALFLEGGVLSFSYQFWISVFSTGKLYDAYLTGSNLMINDQRPLLDANGNGIANEKTDKYIVADIMIGRGMLSASLPPEIRSFSGEQILSSSSVSAGIWAADISSVDPVSRVWAVIIPPDYHPESADIPIINLPVLEMTDPDEDGKYEGTYNGFDLHGTYRIMIYARNNQGLVSMPRETTVVQNGGIIPENNEPVAGNMNFVTNEDLSIQGNLSGSDADNDALTYIIVNDGLIGTVSIIDVNTGSFIYQPHTNENGSDSFTYKVNDGKIDSAIATVSVTINPVEDVSLALDMNISVQRNSSVSDNLKAADGDNDAITFAIAGQPEHGNVILNNAESGNFTYTPTTGYYGSDSFTFTANDGKAVSLPATVSITVDRGYNNPPVAQGSSVSGQEDTPVSGVLEGSDPDSDPLTFILVSAPLKGLVELTDQQMGAFTYTPYANLNGTDAFTYKVSDGMAESAPAVCTVLILPVNDPPVAQAGYLSVNTVTGTAGNLVAVDVENDPLVFSIVENGQKGRAVITDSASGTFIYTPNSTENGIDSFTFKASDGATQSLPARVTVSILLSQAETSRTLSGDGCKIDVSITVTPVATIKSYAIEEVIPAGVNPADISENGVWDEENRKIRWGAFLDNMTRNFTYSLTGDDGLYVITGAGSFDGWNQSISGDSEASIACGAQRVEMPVFNPPGGARVPVEVTITSGTSDAQIRYTTDGSTPTADSELYTAALNFDNPVTIKARAYKDGMYESNVAEARYLPVKSPKVIIVAGGSPVNYLWPATRLVGEYAYKALLYQGYAKEDIMYLSAVTGVDVDGNGELDDIDGLAQSFALHEAITSWALNAENLLLFMTDHGGDSTFQLNPEDILNAADLAAWLNQLQQSMAGRVVVVYDACRSGSFLERLIPLDNKQRIVITSASDENAWFLWGGKLSFSYQFWASIFGNANLYDAYDKGKNLMSNFQSALLDADGDGISGEEADRLATEYVVIGRGAIAAGVAPQIGFVSPPRIINTETSATLAAGNITTLNSIERVWAIIVPPGYAPDSPDYPITDMTEIDLIDPDGDGTYEAVYNDFTSNGVYRIVAYARDSEGLISNPAQTIVSKGTIGDLDGSGYVTITDAILALQAVSGMTPEIHKEADVNGDYRIGIAEVIYILQKIAGLR